MYVEIVNGIVCSECGSPMGKMIDQKGKLLEYTCYGKIPHLRDATKEERAAHKADRLAEVNP
jgi:hypothetical protein